MNTTDFTKTYYIDRRGTHSRKWDGEHLKFSRTDLLPLWVADMDFITPLCIQEAICNYVKATPLGYTMTNPMYIEAVIHWYKRRHNCMLSKDWLTSAPNVITGIMWCIGAFTKANDAIAVLSPVYGAFDARANDAQRRIVAVPLHRTLHNGYTVDYDAFESAIQQNDIKVFIHCNPHNPVGHVSKSFNMASLHQAEIIIPNETLRTHYNAYKARVYHTDADVISEVAISTAYTHPEAEAWLTDALAVIRENYEYLCHELLSTLPNLRISPMDGTYLAWIDFGAYISAEDMHDVFEHQCRIAPSFGEWFGGESYATFVRLNLATSLANIKAATHSIIEHIRP